MTRAINESPVVTDEVANGDQVNTNMKAEAIAEIVSIIKDQLNDEPDNPLLVTMEPKDQGSRKERKPILWFDEDIFKGIEEDEDLGPVTVVVALALAVVMGTTKRRLISITASEGLIIKEGDCRKKSNGLAVSINAGEETLLELNYKMVRH